MFEFNFTDWLRCGRYDFTFYTYRFLIETVEVPATASSTVVFEACLKTVTVFSLLHVQLLVNAETHTFLSLQIH